MRFKDAQLFILPTVILLIIFIVSMSMVTGVSVQTQLHGVTLNTVKPEKTAQSIMSGNYQTQYEKWFSEHFAFRSYFIKLYNQLLYNLDCKINNVVIGKNNVLMQLSYIQFPILI